LPVSSTWRRDFCSGTALISIRETPSVGAL
jgi:hypothetical protein